MGHFIWHVMTERLFSLPLTKVGIHFGHVRMCATPCHISLIIFILEIWISDFNIKDNNLDKLPFEKLHNKFCKYLLGVHRKSSNLASRLELCRER